MISSRLDLTPLDVNGGRFFECPPNWVPKVGGGGGPFCATWIIITAQLRLRWGSPRRSISAFSERQPCCSDSQPHGNGPQTIGSRWIRLSHDKQVLPQTCVGSCPLTIQSDASTCPSNRWHRMLLRSGGAFALSALGIISGLEVMITRPPIISVPSEAGHRNENTRKHLRSAPATTVPAG